MAKHGFFREILLTLCFALLAFQEGYARLAIVEPYPPNIYPIEGTDAQVTCIAHDSENKEKPVRIDFMRKDEYGQYSNMSGQEPHFSFMARTESNGRKLTTTMYIKNVTENDDDEIGGKYECWAHKAGEIKKNTAAHGFTVTVILKKFIPEIKVTPDVVADPNDKVSLTCNVTHEGGEDETELMLMSWEKNGKTLERERYPDPADPTATLRPITIDSARPQHSGTYMCTLIARLHKATDVNITGSVTVSVKPGFAGDISNKVLEIKKGNSVQFPCAAVGDPLLLEWRRQAKRDKHGRCISDSDDRYNISRKDVNSNYILTINTVSYDDEGKYFCCFPTANCSENTKCCQEWTLLVYDLSGTCRTPAGAAMLWKPQNIFVCLSVVITVLKLFT